jgi:hypothetical protein
MGQDPVSHESRSGRTKKKFAFLEYGRVTENVFSMFFRPDITFHGFISPAYFFEGQIYG